MKTREVEMKMVPVNNVVVVIELGPIGTLRMLCLSAVRRTCPTKSVTVASPTYAIKAARKTIPGRYAVEARMRAKDSA